MTEDELNEYDAETVRLTTTAEERIREAEALAASLAGEARSAKKRAQREAGELRKLIRTRADERGKDPQPTLLDMVGTSGAPDWHALPLSRLKLPAGIAAELSFIPNLTCGELDREIRSMPADAETGPFGLAHGDVAEIRVALAEFRDREADSAPCNAAPADLWRHFPVARWTRFGLTEKDVEKLEAGQIKNESAARPIRTVGDLSDFTRATGSGYSRGLKDIKGIGAAGEERISEAETRFWAFWNDGGAEGYARERGLIRGNEAPAGSGSGCIGGGGSGVFRFAGNALESAPFYPA